MSYIEQLQQRLRDAESECSRLRSEIALRDRCIAWCLEHGAQKYSMSVDEAGDEGICDDRGTDLEVPAEFAAIIGGKA